MRVFPSKYKFWNIVYEVAVRIVGLLDFKLSRSEQKLSFKTQSKKKHDRYHPVFIIGVPRTGSTFVYQLITNNLKVKYFDNIVDIMHKYPLTAFHLSKFIYNDKPHNCFKSHHGTTLKYGLHAPSEAGNYWYRFIPEGQYKVDALEVTDKLKNKLKTEIQTILKTYEQPLVIKNLANSLRLKFIFELFPYSRIIIIERDLESTLNSIINARRKNDTPANSFWSIFPPEIKQSKYPDERSRVLDQVRNIEKYINRDIKQFPDKQVLRVGYENIVNEPEKMVEKIRHFVNAEKRQNLQ
ncbi:MAG: sulfotransferase family protein [Bacteroidota bacterium]